MVFRDKKFLTGLAVGACVFSLVFLVIIYVMSLQHKVELTEGRTPTFYELQHLIKTQSIFEATEKELVDGMYQGVLDATGDKYARYIPADGVEWFNERVVGEFGGIGITFEIDPEESYPVVLSVRDGGPAYRVGMQVGDFILKIDGVDTYEKTSEEIVSLVRGSEGSTVHLEFSKDKGTQEADVVREIMNIPTVQYAILEDRIGLIRLEQFIGTSPEEIYATYEELVSQHELEGLILDLTYNGGGTLDSVARIAALFLPENEVLIQVKRQGKTDVQKIPYSEHKIDLPLVVVVNEYSASASEVLAGALRDHERAEIVGKTTFGKGSVQTTFQMQDGSQVLVTTAEFCTPKGDEINGVGLTPEHYVEDIEDMLQTAVDILLGDQ